MAIESVTATTEETFSSHVIDEVSIRLSNAHAIADLLSECNQSELCKGTLSGIAYLLMQTLSEAKELVETGKLEAQS